MKLPSASVNPLYQASLIVGITILVMGAIGDSLLLPEVSKVLTRKGLNLKMSVRVGITILPLKMCVISDSPTLS